MKKNKKLKLSLITSVLIFGLFLSSFAVSASFVTRKQVLNGYSLIGLHVVNIEFNAQGYSYATTGFVTDMWFTYWAWFPNTISNDKTWKAYHPSGEYAKGSVDLGAGFNSPWGVIGVSTGRKYFSILF